MPLATLGLWSGLTAYPLIGVATPALGCRLPKRSSAPSRHRCREGAIGERQGATVGGFEGDGFAGLEILARATASMSALRSVAVIWDAIALAWMHLMRA